MDAEVAESFRLLEVDLSTFPSPSTTEYFLGLPLPRFMPLATCCCLFSAGDSPTGYFLGLPRPRFLVEMLDKLQFRMIIYVHLQCRIHNTLFCSRCSGLSLFTHIGELIYVEALSVCVYIYRCIQSRSVSVV